MVWWDREARTDRRDQKDSLDQVENLDPWDWLVKRLNFYCIENK